MNYTHPHQERTLLDFDPYDLQQRYPDLPIWAVNAFQSLQGPRQHWTPEARALLNIAHVPPIGMHVEKLPLHAGATSEDLRGSFVNDAAWRRAKPEIDLWLLSRDLIRAKNDGWKQSNGKPPFGSDTR
jgi:hypothetical protein